MVEGVVHRIELFELLAPLPTPAVVEPVAVPVEPVAVVPEVLPEDDPALLP